MSPAFVLAEFYKYKDAQGNIVFTDDVSQIPEDQRPNIKTFESVIPAQAAKPEIEKPVEKPEQREDPSEKADKDLDAQFKWFVKEKAYLDKEKVQIEALRPTIGTQKEQKEYNEKVAALNKRIGIYREKHETYKKQTQKNN